MFKLVVVFLLAALCCVMAKPAVLAYSAPVLAEPLSAVVDSTYHGVSGYYASPVVASYAAAPYVTSYAAAPYVAGYSAYPALATTLLR